MSISSKLFAHIFNDAFLLGSVGLQGQQFENTVGFLNEHLEQLDSEEVPASVLKLKKVSNRLVEYEKGIRNVFSEHHLSQLAGKLASDIRSLEEDDYLFFPGGWAGNPSGHAMIYQFHYDEAGNLLFSINNSGSGIQYHQKQSRFDKETYNPVLTYKIPKEKLGDSGLESVLGELIRAKVSRVQKSDITYDAEYLYQNIIAKFGYLNGFIDDSLTPPVDDWLTAGQISGTCAQRSLHQMIKQRFETQDEYRQFIYKFKFHALVKFYEEAIDHLGRTSDKSLANPKVYSQLEKGIRHCLRLLLLNSTVADEPLFPPEQVALESKQMQDMLASIRKIKDQKKPHQAEPVYYSTNQPLKTSVSLRGDVSTFELRESLVATPPASLIQKFKKIQKDHFASDVQAVMSMVSKARLAGEHHASCELIEYFFNNMALPKRLTHEKSKYFSGEDTNSAFLELLSNVKTIQQSYFESMTFLVGKNTILPNMVLLKANSLSVLAHLIHNHSQFKKYASSYESHLNSFMQQVENTSFAANYHPELDDRLSQIRKLFDGFAYDPNILSYYKELVNHYPEEKMLLQKQFETYARDMDPELKVAIVREQAQALYVLFDKLKNNNFSSSPLIEAFQTQRLIEENLYYHSQEIANERGYSVDKDYFRLEKYSFSDELYANQSVEDKKCRLKVSRFLTESVYDFSQIKAPHDPQHHAIEYFNDYGNREDNKIPRSNRVQIAPLGKNENEGEARFKQTVINKDTIESRELYHLRGDADTQIVLTLEYYIKHIAKLSDVEHQKYLEANLFQPGLLNGLFRNGQGETLFELTNELVGKGIKYFSEKLFINDKSLNLIRLQTKLVQYAYEFSQDPSLLKEQFDNLSHWIDVCAGDPLIQAALHQYRFELVALSSNWREVFIKAEDYEQILVSFFQTRANSNQLAWTDANQLFRSDYATQAFGAMVLKNPQLLQEKHLKSILISLGMVPPKGSIRIDGDFPRFHLQTDEHELHLDLATGRVFIGEMVLATTPIALLRHPLFERAGLKVEQRSLQSPDGSRIEVHAGPDIFRFVKNKQGEFDILKQFEINGKKSWYQLFANSEAQLEYFQIASSSLATLDDSVPDSLTDCAHQMWVSKDNNQKSLITDEQHKPLYQMSENDSYSYYASSQLFRIDEGVVNKKARFLSPDSKTVVLLSRFESKRFIHAVDSTSAGGLIDIKFPRYGIQLTQENSSSPIQYHWQGRNLKLSENQLSLGQGVSPLTFEDTKGQVLLFPVQHFVAKGASRDDEYYLLEPDTDAIVMEQREKPGLNKEDGYWQYQQTESSMMIKVIEGKPFPENAEQALFLCYQYMGAHEFEKALDVLNDCEKRLGGVSGEFNELKFISWIVNKLPQLMKKQSDDVVLSTPEITACKLKALSLMSKFKSQGHVFDKPEVLNLNPELNQDYHQNLQNEVLAFDKGFSSYIYSQFTDYQKIRRDLSKRFELSMRDRKSLLDFYHRHSKDEALGALGYEWVQLRFDYLKREQYQLFKTGEMRALSASEKERLDEIDKALKNHQGVTKTQSKLVYKNFSTTIPSDAELVGGFGHISYSLTKVDALKGFEETEISTEALLRDVFHLSVSERSLVHHFKALLSIANNKAHPLFEKLKTFTKSMLIANRHADLSKQTDNILLFCYTLHGVCCASERFKLTGYYKNFESVLNFAKQTQPEPIPIPELEDDLSEILIDANTLWKEIEPPSAAVQPIIDVGSLPEFDLVKKLDVEHIHEACEAFRKLMTIFQTGVDESVGLESSALFESSESLAGAVKFKYLTELQQNAIDVFEELDLRQLRSQLSDAESFDNGKISELERIILELANEGPEDKVSNIYWSANVMAEKRNQLDITKLISLYFQNDKNVYMKETGLSALKTDRLHTLMAEYLIRATERQQLLRSKKLLALYESAESVSEKNDHAFQLAKNLFAKNLVDYVKEPSQAVLQYMEEILMYAPQKQALGRLLNQTESGLFNEVIEKVIMGGGKSKVIAPSIAKKKANGSNLVILEVPPALLQTNYIDLQAASARLFDQRAFLFQFDRDSDCSVVRLKELYTLLTDVMLNKDYIVTTGTAIQSLELKYFELLNEKPDVSDFSDDKTYEMGIENWYETVEQLERLLKLFKNRGDVLIDEVHQGLLLKKKLNFTLGERRSISKPIINNVTDFYAFLEHVPLDDESEIDSGKTLLDAVSNPKLIVDESNLDHLITNLAHQLVYHSKSPLASFVKAFGEHDTPEKKLLLAYLKDEATAVPTFVSTASKSIKDKLAIYKQEIGYMLPYTLQRKHGEQYGPSQNVDVDPFNRACAIPYKANNVPSERSRFGNILETMNYTIQSLFIRGISKELLLQTLEEWQVEARQAVLSGNYKSIDETPIASTYQLIMKDESAKLSQLDLKDDEMMDAVHHTLKHHQSLIFEILNNKILPQLKSDAQILHNDAYNHVDIVRTCQGMSGTPWNHSTYHQRLKYSNQSGLGSDALIIQTIAQKEPVIRSLEFTDTAAYLETIFSTYTSTDQVRALIDISASFKGIDNLTVAEQIASYIKIHPEQFEEPLAVKYVLFFNKENELSAIDITEPDSDVIVIGGSSESNVSERLGVGPERRFTFYDQDHTVGTDIRQGRQSKAVVTIDKDTHLQSFEQGALRMRGLIEGDQTIDMVVPPSLKGQSFKELCKRMAANENEQLKNDHFYAAIDQMKNLVRNNLKEKILAVRGDLSVEKKHQLFKQFKEFFIKNNELDFFKLYGGIVKEQETAIILERIKSHLFASWKRVLTHSDMLPEIDEQHRLEESLENIKSRYLVEGMCHETQPDSLNEQLEVEVEQLVEVEIEQEIKYEVFDPSLTPADYREHAYRKGKPLSDFCSKNRADYQPDFDPHLLVSYNYIKSYQGQSTYLNHYLKPVHAIFWEFDAELGLKATLLSQQEVQECKRVGLEKNQWIGTTQHHVLMGHPPKQFTNNRQYQKLVEQIRFFNGEFQLLTAQKEPFHWIEDDFSKKLDYFNEFLLMTRESPQGDISKLKTLFSSQLKIFQYIATHPELNLVETDWALEFPDVEIEDTHVFQELAKAFVFINENLEQDLKAVDWSEKFELDYRGQGYINSYIQKIEEHKKILSVIVEYYSSESHHSMSAYLNLNLKIKDLFAQHFPDISPFLSTTSDHEQFDLNILLTIFKSIPSIAGKHQRVLLGLLESDENWETILEGIKVACDKDDSFLPMILDSDVRLSPEHFESFMTLPQTRKTIGLIAKSENLTKAHLTRLFGLAKTQERQAHILNDNLLTLLDKEPNDLLALVDGYQIDFNEMRRVYSWLKRIKPSISSHPDLLWALAKSADSDDARVKLISYIAPNFIPEVSETIALVEEDVRDIVFYLLLKNPELSQAQIKEMVPLTESRDVYLEALKRAEDADLLESIVNSPLRSSEDVFIILEKQKLSQDELLTLLADSATESETIVDDEKVVLSILSHSNCGQKVINTVLEHHYIESPPESILKKLLSREDLTANNYATIFTHFEPSLEKLKQLSESGYLTDKHALILDKNHALPEDKRLFLLEQVGDSEVLYSILHHAELSSEGLMSVLDNDAVDIEIIDLILTKDHVNEAVLQKIVSHSVLSDLSKTRLEETVSVIMSHSARCEEVIDHILNGLYDQKKTAPQSILNQLLSFTDLTDEQYQNLFKRTEPSLETLQLLGENHCLSTESVGVLIESYELSKQKFFIILPFISSSDDLNKALDDMTLDKEELLLVLGSDAVDTQTLTYLMSQESVDVEFLEKALKHNALNDRKSQKVENVLLAILEHESQNKELIDAILSLYTEDNIDVPKSIGELLLNDIDLTVVQYQTILASGIAPSTEQLKALLENGSLSNQNLRDLVVHCSILEDDLMAILPYLSEESDLNHALDDIELSKEGILTVLDCELVNIDTISKILTQKSVDVEILKQALTHEALTTSSSTEAEAVMSQIVSHEAASDNLFKDLLEGKLTLNKGLSSQAIIKKLLAVPSLKEEQYESIFKLMKPSFEELELLCDNDYLTARLIQVLLDEYELSEKEVLLVLPEIDDVEILNSLVQDHQFSTDGLISALEHELTDIETIDYLLAQDSVDEVFLEKAIKHTALIHAAPLQKEKTALEIVSHKHRNSEVINYLLSDLYEEDSNLPKSISDYLLGCTDLTDEQYQSIFEKMNPSLEQLLFLEEQACLTEESVEKLIDSHELSEEQFLAVLPNISSATYLNKALKSLTLIKEELLTVLNSSAVDIKTISKLLEQDSVDGDVLEKCLAHQALKEAQELDAETVILSIISHEHRNEKVVNQLLNEIDRSQVYKVVIFENLLTLTDLSEEQYQSIVKEVKPSLEDIRFLSENNCLSSKLVETLIDEYEWTEKEFLLILPNIETTEYLNKVIDKMELSQDTLLSLLEHELTNDKTIFILLNQDNVDEAFLETAAAHEQLFKPSSIVGARNVETIINHPLTNGDVISALLGQPELSTIDIENMLDIEGITVDNLKVMATLVQDDVILAQKIYDHPLLTNEKEDKQSILSILSQGASGGLKTYVRNVVSDEHNESLNHLDNKAKGLGYQIDLQDYKKDIQTIEQSNQLLKAFNEELERKITQDKAIFVKLLGDLEAKASSLKNGTSESSQKAYLAITEMVSQLTNKGDDYFTSKRDPNEYSTFKFCNDCKTVIKDKMIEGQLNVHRYLFGSLLAIINNLLKFIGQIFSGSNRDKFLSTANRKYQFFDARTDAEKLTDELDKNLDTLFEDKPTTAPKGG